MACTGQLYVNQKVKVKCVRDLCFCIMSGSNITNSEFVGAKPKLNFHDNHIFLALLTVL